MQVILHLFFLQITKKQLFSNNSCFLLFGIYGIMGCYHRDRLDFSGIAMVDIDYLNNTASIHQGIGI